MEQSPNSHPESLKWLEIWRIAFLQPKIRSYSRIASDPKATIKWGLFWGSIAILIAWISGPLTSSIAGMITNQFGGKETYTYVYLIGIPITIIIGLLGCLTVSALGHGIARIFNGKGSFRQLFFCWAVIQLPFLLLAGLVLYFPFFFPQSREFTFSRAGLIIQITRIAIGLLIYIYLFYGQVVAYCAVEQFKIGKGFGILIILSIILSIALVCLSYVINSSVMTIFRY